MDALNTALEGVSDKSLCNWFFFMYVLAVIGAALQVVMIIINTTVYLRSKIHPSVKAGFLFGTLMALVVLGIAVTNSLFLYSLCDRSLIRDAE
jgi:hypothetical protein